MPWGKMRTLLSALWRAAFLVTFVVGVILLPSDIVTIAGTLSVLGDGLARVVVGIAGIAAIVLLLSPDKVRAIIRPSPAPGVPKDESAADSEDQEDGPLEQGIAEDIRKGERLRDRYRSGDPPGSDKAGKWAVAVIERLRAHDEEGYVDRFHGETEDQVHPPHDAAAQADYLDGRLAELRRILASLRGQPEPRRDDAQPRRVTQGQRRAPQQRPAVGPSRPVLPTVPDPPPLPEGALIDSKGRVVDREALKDHLRAEVTHGWELLDREGESSGARTDWAQGIRKTLARALGERHADYFYRAETPKEIRPNTWRGLAFNVVIGGPPGQRSRSFVHQRIARLEKIAAQL